MLKQKILDLEAGSGTRRNDLRRRYNRSRLKKQYKNFLLKKNARLLEREYRKHDPALPTVVITAGATGSGKSSLLKKVRELLFDHDHVPFEEFLIDDYVENSDNYKRKVHQIIHKYNCKKEKTWPPAPSASKESCNLDRPSTKLLNDFASAYFEVRNVGPCNLDKETKSCREVMNRDLKKAIAASRNILIETTGKKLPLRYMKLIKKYASRPYNVVFVYSMVNFSELMKRNASRARKQMKTFIDSEYSSPAPRLPDISEYAFKQAVSTIQKTVVKLRNECLRQRSKCDVINKDGKFVLLIFDNNTWDSKLVYDSQSTDKSFLSKKDFKKMIYNYTRRMLR